MKERLKELVAQAIDLSNGSVYIQNGGAGADYVYNEKLHCPKCDISFPDIELRSFSFNSPYGACTTCSGLGRTFKLDPSMVIANPRLTIAQGALRVWDKVFTNQKWIDRISSKKNIYLKNDQIHTKKSYFKIIKEKDETYLLKFSLPKPGMLTTSY